MTEEEEFIEGPAPSPANQSWSEKIFTTTNPTGILVELDVMKVRDDGSFSIGVEDEEGIAVGYLTDEEYHQQSGARHCTIPESYQLENGNRI